MCFLGAGIWVGVAVTGWGIYIVSICNQNKWVIILAPTISFSYTFWTCSASAFKTNENCSTWASALWILTTSPSPFWVESFPFSDVPVRCRALPELDATSAKSVPKLGLEWWRTCPVLSWLFPFLASFAGWGVGWLPRVDGGEVLPSWEKLESEDLKGINSVCFRFSGALESAWVPLLYLFFFFLFFLYVTLGL